MSATAALDAGQGHSTAAGTPVIPCQLHLDGPLPRSSASVDARRHKPDAPHYDTPTFVTGHPK